MTDHVAPPDEARPTTEAGRRLLAEWEPADGPDDTVERGILAIEDEARAAVLQREPVEPWLLNAVESAILNIQHNRFGAAVAGLRVARDKARAALSATTPDEGHGPLHPDHIEASDALGRTDD